MIDLKPCTATEIADIKRNADSLAFGGSKPRRTIRRLIATVEQRDEQIRLLRDVVIFTADQHNRPQLKKFCDEVLTATEPTT